MDKIVKQTEVYETLKEELRDCSVDDLVEIILDSLNTQGKINLLNQFAIGVE